MNISNNDRLVSLTVNVFMPPPHPHEEASNSWHESELVNVCMKILEAHYCVLGTARITLLGVLRKK